MSPDHHGHQHAPGPLADASVRLARENDAPAVGLVQAAVWRDAYAGVLPAQVLDTFEPTAFANAWRRSLAAPPAGVYRLLAACAGDQVVGFASIGPSQDPDASPETGELSAIGVHPRARRAGHGSRLLNATVDTLRGAGAETLHTWTYASRASAPCSASMAAILFAYTAFTAASGPITAIRAVGSAMVASGAKPGPPMA